ncbi:hypothetical protein IFM89_024835 [Coptis chinensis]|uniref:Endonuclease/exonuclease/phosphatase domain-containing protein n=1 Tax=Coptis chinensis TaxID=261450 RepID=A0A835HRX9_9MAGN|nr:hypothetical protein IFM89_024835 [Coptis chinensis]
MDKGWRWLTQISPQGHHEYNPRVELSGCRKPSTVRHLLSLIGKENPDILFLSETKLSGASMASINLQLGFPNIFSVSSCNKAGGLALLWKDNIDLNIFYSCKHIINARINTGPGNKSWVVSFFYGSPYAPLKKASWNNIQNTRRTGGDPWLIIGDLNIIFDQNEKQGGELFELQQSEFAADFIQQEGLIDLGYSGNSFTWTNGREGRANVKQRLDRGLANTDWFILFPEFKLFHLPRIESDHSPIMLHLNPNTNKAPKPFRFQAMWINHESYLPLINQAWVNSESRNKIFEVKDKLHNTKTVLKEWNKNVFGDVRKNIADTTKAIDNIQVKSPNAQNGREESFLKERLDNLLKHEEMFWKQKSRDKWIPAGTGDFNTKFFHATTICRRKRNRIDWLKHEGRWLSHRRDISRCLVNHFSSLMADDIPDQTINYDKSGVLFSKHLPYKFKKIIRNILKIKGIGIKDSMGGLDIRDFSTANEACSGKLAWRLLSNPHELWGQVLKNKYFPHSKGSQLPFLKKGSSWLWKSCHASISSIMNNAVWDIGDGSNINIWTEPWVPKDGGVVHIFGPRPRMAPESVSELFLPNTKSWNIHLLETLFPAFIVQYIMNVYVKDDATNASLF